MTVATPQQQGFLKSRAMQEAAMGLQSAIAAGGGVLLCGEHGTGRELFARAIHRAADQGAFDGSVERLLRASMQQPASARPFIVVDCSRGSEVEEHLFGETAAPAGGDPYALDRLAPLSALDEANGGTLLLAHVAEMPRRVQSRLVRVLREGEARVQSNGDGPITVPVRIRVMGTTDVRERLDFTEQVDPELLKRLSRTTIQLPALRDRREDIPALVQYLLGHLCARLDIPVKRASTQATELLAALQWRGNVAELRALLMALVIKVPGRLLRLRDVLGHVRLDGRAEAFVYGGTLREARERFEREYVAHVLEQHRGRMAEAAKALGIQRTNLYRKVRQLAVQRRRPGRSVGTS